MPRYWKIPKLEYLYEAKKEEPVFLSIGPSASPSKPLKPTWPVNSYLSLLPFRIFKSNTPEVASPYSAGQAPVKKSELLSTLLFNILTGPPVVPCAAKWFGLGMSTPSSRQRSPDGELPRIIISFLASLDPDTPAKLAGIRAGSPSAPAYRCVSSMV